MRITVLSGSPKGEMSVTLQYFNYIKKNFSDHEFEIFDIGHDIKKIEKKPELFEEIIEKITSSDGILWCFPLYFLLVPSQLKRFIELIFENKAEGAFKEKYATALTTSVHFYDHTAHNYIHGVCDDLEMKYIDGYSAGMMDLLKPKERKNLLKFAEDFFGFIEEDKPTTRVFQHLSYEMPEYVPGDIPDASKTNGRKIVLVTDSDEKDSNLDRMIDVFIKSIPNEVEVVNLNEISMKGGCLGCINCGYEGVCLYKDDVRDMYQDKLMPADAIVYAGSIKDRFLSSRWKMLMDRSFFNGHRPVLMGKQAAFLISGPLRQIPNLRQVLIAFTEVMRMNIVDFVTDEYQDSSYTTSLIGNLANRVLWAADEQFKKPTTFLGVGGHKVLRDFIYNSKFIFKADDDFYKEHGLYDFPQKEIGLRIPNLILPPLLRIPVVRERFQKEIKPQMVKRYKKYLKD